MSRLTAHSGARKRVEDSERIADSEDESRNDRPLDDPWRDDVFDLIIEPQRATNANVARSAVLTDTDRKAPRRAGSDLRNLHTTGIADLSRLSIDKERRLHWDGKPVEVRGRILMSRLQIVGASVVAVFVVIGAVGAAIHGSVAALDWACRLGWTTNYCTLPNAAPSRLPDIPA